MIAPVMARVALRNLRRQARRTSLTAAAMIVGGALLIFSLSLGDGSHEDWIRSGARLGTGHITIQAPRYAATRKIEDRLSAESRAAAETALARPEIARHVVAKAPRVAVPALASSPAGARPAQVVGVEPTPEAAFSLLDDKLVRGRYLEPHDRLAAYIGAGLAERLDVKLGARLVLTAQDAAGEITGQLVRVVGIFRTGIPEIDESVVHIPLATAANWLRLDDDVTAIAVLLDSSRNVDRVARALGRALADPVRAGRLAVATWREAMPELHAAVRIDQLGNYIWQVIMFTIIALGIVNTILMSVLHRRREFGLLQALGLTPGQTGRLVVLEGAFLTTVSGLIGIGLGLFVTWLLWRDGLDISFTWSEEWSFSGVVMNPVIVPLFSAARVVQALLFIFAIGTLASLYPAYQAARIDVAAAMKFER